VGLSGTAASTSSPLVAVPPPMLQDRDMSVAPVIHIPADKI
jgi:hypothetical protein